MAASPLCEVWQPLEARIRTAEAQGSKAELIGFKLPTDSFFSGCPTGSVAANRRSSLKGVGEASDATRPPRDLFLRSRCARLD